MCAAIDHQETERIVLDIGSGPVTGIHVHALERLRRHYGLEERPVRVIEPYQMLGFVEEDLREVLGIDVVGARAANTMFGYYNGPPFKQFRTFWGQEVLVPRGFSEKKDEKGNLLSFPEGDTSLDPSARMPVAGYFFDAIERQEPIDEESLNVEDNLEEFGLFTEADLEHWKKETEAARATGCGVMSAPGGTALGDIALVPGMQLRHPRGIRSVAEWYMSILMREDYIREVFDRQSALAVENLALLYGAIGDNIDVINICGTDFGTQDSTFCSPEQFDSLWLPYYKRITDWIHEHTPWKVFKHSCGSVETFMDRFIRAGIDIINPVQVNARGMDPEHLKKSYGDDLTFWGGGVDTQHTLPYGTPEEVREQVLRHCEVFSRGGGFVFNTVHNIQADVPVENMVAMFNAIQEFNGMKQKH